VYSKEELVAEFASAFICAEAGIDSTINNSAAYIKGWTNRLQQDPKLLITAASKGQKAADYILNRSQL
jgi:antirestriction protein ArdC